MKKRVMILSVVICLSVLAGCTGEDAVISALPKYETGTFYSSGGFQDYTDYGVYTYDSLDMEALKATGYFSEVTAGDATEILAHIADFENWVEVAAAGAKMFPVSPQFSTALSTAVIHIVHRFVHR